VLGDVYPGNPNVYSDVVWEVVVPLARCFVEGPDPDRLHHPALNLRSSTVDL
jgi:hypothetical protein